MNQRVLITFQVAFFLLLVLTVILFYTYRFYSEPWDAYRGPISLLSQIGIGLGGVIGAALLVIWGSKDKAQNKMLSFLRKLATHPLVLIVGIVLLTGISISFSSQLLGSTQIEVFANERMDFYLVNKTHPEGIRLGELLKEESRKYRLPVGMNHLLGLSKPERDTLFEDQKVYVDMWGKEGPIQISVIKPEQPQMPMESKEGAPQKSQPVVKSSKHTLPSIQQESKGDNSPNVVVQDGDATFNFNAADLSPPPAKDTTRIDTLTH